MSNQRQDSSSKRQAKINEQDAWFFEGKEREVPDLPPNEDKEFWLDAEREVINTNHPLFAFSPSLSGHQWRQQGPYLVCKSCPVRHSIYIGVDKRLVGFTEDGQPKVIDRA